MVSFLRIPEIYITSLATAKIYDLAELVYLTTTLSPNDLHPTLFLP
jgi:hypothetical protein